MSFYTSLTGLNAATTELAVTSNNIANAGTSGFKRSNADFGDIFATSPLQKASSVVGAGVALKEVVQEFSQGNIEFSANSLDLAITGDGFFALKTTDGANVYTRNGGFMLNEQNQMVNAAGQALMALPVDSTNKADFSEPLKAMAIPRTTVAEFSPTSEVELGLNLPSTAEPITAAFNPNKPETYHKTTSFTVYGASGSSHLTTIYYVKTASATADKPTNKWQTYVYIDDQPVAPALVQASDTGGDQFFVNKYGEIKTASELRELQRTSENSAQYLITTGTIYKKYSYDQLTSPAASKRATVGTEIAADSTFIDNLNLTNNQDGVDFSSVDANGDLIFSRAKLTDMFSVKVDGSDAVNIGLEHLAGKDVKLSGTQIAFELQNQINARFGDNANFNFTGDGNPGQINLTRTDDTGTIVNGINTLTLDVKALLGTQGTADGVTLIDANNEATPEAVAYTINKALAAAGAGWSDVTVSYDAVRRGFRFEQTDPAKQHNLYIGSADADAQSIFNITNFDAANTDWGTNVAPSDQDLESLLLRDVEPNGSTLGTKNQRYGLKVEYQDGSFLFSSGTTGDASSIEISLNTATANNATTLTASSSLAKTLFGMEGTAEAPIVGQVLAQTSAVNNLPTLRGQGSEPAKVTGNQMGVDPSTNFAVTAANKNLTVIIDGISSQVNIDEGNYSIGTFTKALQTKINLMADALGRTVNGVVVGFDESSSAITITGSTTGTESFIQINGHSDWGLENVPAAFGSTSTYVSLDPDTDGASDVYVVQNQDGSWDETTDKGDFNEDDIPFWSPIFLDKGELTFDTSGSLVSPVAAYALNSAAITGTTVNVNYNGSTQYNSPFAVLNQNQNGAPEGDLIGVNIGDDGLVVASYSNGSQKSLGKIIIANFSSPQGLRQIGDSSFFATSDSGEASFGEAGSAGFGTLRAGSRERSNVDLTAELVDLITAQRNFQANAKAIETTSAMTQAIVNIRA
jgi:flagellar hook-basal body protein